MNLNTTIEFLRKKDFKFIKELGSGAFGRTILLKDEYIHHEFVCKKYMPQIGIKKEDYYQNFVDEIKLLHLVYHPNIVRVFNYYLYPERQTGYLLMEYIDGVDILSYLKKYPENINSIFEQTINGFLYLEEENILHRDIRPLNILVNSNHVVKIIDFGFGKQIHFNEDNNKSITINWFGGEMPNEFKEKIYNHKTEIYFIGKLFQYILAEVNTSFKYMNILKQMINSSLNNRINSFSEIYKNIKNDITIFELFTDEERSTYQNFSYYFFESLSRIKPLTKLEMDINKIIIELDILCKRTMLEDYVGTQHVLKIFLTNNFRYKQNSMFNVDTLVAFTKFFKGLSFEQQNIVLYNLETKLDNVSFDLDEIPF